MWTALRRFGQFFFVGFVITFLIYLFVRFSANAVLLGVAIGAGGGVVVAALIFFLEHRFPERRGGPPEAGV